MAIFRCQITPVRRADGRTAVAAAAYRAGESLRNEQTGRLTNHSRRQDVLHRQIILPARAADAAPGWVRDRAQLWNAAERAESGRHARPAREYQLALPAELTHPQRVDLVQAFGRDLAERYGVAVDLAIHAPRLQGDDRNVHAHVLTTTREITAAGLGAKTGLDLSARERSARGLPDHSAEYRHVRERWAALTNEAFTAAGLDLRVDHRSLAAQGIDREPRPSLPIFAVHMERRGERSRLAEALRQHYSERLERRLARSAEAAPSLEAASRPPTPPLDDDAPGLKRRIRVWVTDPAPPPARRPDAPQHTRRAELAHWAVPTAASKEEPDRSGERRTDLERIRQEALEHWRRHRERHRGMFAAPEHEQAHTAAWLRGMPGLGMEGEEDFGL